MKLITRNAVVYFRCKKEQFKSCLENDKCLKESEFLNRKGYIVSSGFEADLGHKRIAWKEICPKDLISVPLKSGKGQFTRHNPIELTNKQANELFYNLSKI